MATGKFITFEGIDGAGKSTHVESVAEQLRASGKMVVTTREPGGTALGEKLRALLLQEPMHLETEALLMFAARREHLAQVITPALARGDIVITDRFADSTRIYQGITRGDLAGTVTQLHDLMIGTDPDLTLLVDIDPAIGLARARARAGSELRFEDMGLDVQTRMRAGFLDLAARHARFRVIDGARDADAVAADILATALAHLA